MGPDAVILCPQLLLVASKPNWFDGSVLNLSVYPIIHVTAYKGCHQNKERVPNKSKLLKLIQLLYLYTSTTVDAKS